MTQPILFGSDNTQNIVAVKARQSDALVYVRQGDVVTESCEAFTPWLLLASSDYIPADAKIEELSGDDGYRFLALFEKWSAFLSAKSDLANRRVDFLAANNPEKQFLAMTGKTLFKGMTIEDIHRVQVDIETYGESFSMERGTIILISISDNRGFEVVLDGSEPDMLQNLVSIIRDRNPDVIEGHNIFNFDLPFISARAKKHGVALTLGRDGSEMTFSSDRGFAVGGFRRPYTPAYISGRHIIDTLLAVQRYDVGKGELESYGLKYVAKFYGFAADERVYIDGSKINEVWQNDPESLKKYALHDVIETRSLAAMVCPAAFYQTQMAPENYQESSTSGNGEKINSLLIREYLRQRQSVPKPKEPTAVAGGYTEIRRTGLLHRVVKCDVESLYPSLMRTFDIGPESDKLKVFLPALSELIDRRLEAKSKAKTGPVAERQYWDGLQSSFKILINSFYGYLGGAPFNFNDFDAASMITTKGQAIVKQIASAIEDMGGVVIEIDTDGVYFQAPESVASQEDEEAFIDSIGSKLPQGIRLAHDGRWAAMISLKIKNYALIGYDGKRQFKGASIRSRSDELFGREFISQIVDALALGDFDAAGKVYLDFRDRIMTGQMGVEDFARRERITSKTFSSTNKRRAAEAAKGVRVGEYVSLYEKSNGDLGLAQDYNNDENRSRLIEKLYKFALRFRPAFGDDFETIFPKPSAKSKRNTIAFDPTQGKLDF